MTALWIVIDVDGAQSFSCNDEFHLIRIAFADIVSVFAGNGGLVVRLATGGESRTEYVNRHTGSRLVANRDGTWEQPRLLIEDLAAGPGADIDVTWETTDGDTWTRRENYRPTGRPVRK